MIIPVYNGEKTIAKCLESLLNQTVWKKFHKEIIVVDDGSKDLTSEIIKHYTVKYIRIEHSGSVVATNTGIKVSTGDIIFIADAHAYYAANYLELLVKELKKRNVGTAIGAMLAWTSNKNNFLDKYWRQERFLKLKNYKPWTGWIFRRSDIEKVGLFRTTDVEFTNRIIALGYQISYQPKALWWHKQPSTLYEIFVKGFMRGVVAAINIANKKRDREEIKQFFLGMGSLLISFLLLLLIMINIYTVISLLALFYFLLLIKAIKFVKDKRESLSSFKIFCFLFPLIKVFVPFSGLAIGILVSPFFMISKKFIRYIRF